MDMKKIANDKTPYYSFAPASRNQNQDSELLIDNKKRGDKIIFSLPAHEYTLQCLRRHLH